MTYGENGATIRTALTRLLRHHRIQHRLPAAAPRSRTDADTLAEREVMAAQIRRYRQAALTWCHQAVMAADPQIGGDLLDTGGHRKPAGPYVALRTELERALRASSARLPTLEELTTPQDNELVESWRTIARATALGEHDFTAGLGRGSLSAAQGLTVLRDVAAITQALVLLDRRYAKIPGWERLHQPTRLGWAALATALEAAIEEPDYTVDRRGWKPPARPIDGPARPGIHGVLQAEHNLLVRLNAFPSAVNLKLVVESQRIISAGLADRLLASGAGPELRDAWKSRAETYDLIHRELRNVGGRVGKGAPAAAEAANAVRRLRRLPNRTEIDPRVLTGFDKLFTRIDTRIADIIDRGLTERLLAIRVRVPRLIDATGHTVQPVRERYVPVTSPVQTDLPAIVRNRLRPTPQASTPPAGALRSRAELHSALVHQPESRGRGVGL